MRWVLGKPHRREGGPGSYARRRHSTHDMENRQKSGKHASMEAPLTQEESTAVMHNPLSTRYFDDSRNHVRTTWTLRWTSSPWGQPLRKAKPVPPAVGQSSYDAVLAAKTTTLPVDAEVDLLWMADGDTLPDVLKWRSIAHPRDYHDCMLANT